MSTIMAVVAKLIWPTLAGIAGTMVWPWVRQMIEAHIQEGKLRAALVQLSGVAAGVVEQVWQEYWRERKAARAGDSPGGSDITPEEKRRAFEMAKGKLMALMSAKDFAILRELGKAGTDALVDSLLSDAVQRAKGENRIPLTAMFGAEFQKRWAEKQGAGAGNT